MESNEMCWYPTTNCVLEDLKSVRSANVGSLIAGTVVTYHGTSYKLSQVTYDDSLDYTLLVSITEPAPSHDISDVFLEAV